MMLRCYFLCNFVAFHAFGTTCKRCWRQQFHRLLCMKCTVIWLLRLQRQKVRFERKTSRTDWSPTLCFFTPILSSEKDLLFQRKTMKNVRQNVKSCKLMNAHDFPLWQAGSSGKSVVSLQQYLLLFEILFFTQMQICYANRKLKIAKIRCCCCKQSFTLQA